MKDKEKYKLNWVEVKNSGVEKFEAVKAQTNNQNPESK